MRFKVYKDATGRFRWTLYAVNNLKVADSGEGYEQKQACLHGVSLVKGTSSRSQYTFYRDAVGAHRWRLVATNGRIIADSAEGYVSLAHCQHGADLAISTSALTPVDDSTKRGDSSREDAVITITLNAAELAVLDRQPPSTKSRGGWQALMVRLQQKVNRSNNRLTLNWTDLERLSRYAFHYGNGGWENRLRGIFERTLGPNLGQHLLSNAA